MNVLTTENLVKRYKDHTVVDNVNMHIEAGDIYGFVGENGAGKTTVIRMITGLAKPTKGSYSLFDVKYNDRNIINKRKKVAAIVESVSLSGSMSALENLKVQCMLTNSTKTDDELIELINLVGLDYKAIAKKRIRDFSLGMRQRMGLACVMVSDPEFIVLDEPLNGLDPQGFIDVRETILKLAKEKEVTFLISSHVLSELDKICNKVGFISHGKLLEEISIEDLHSQAREKVEIIFKNSEDLNKFNSITKYEDKYADENSLVIFDKVDMNQLVKVLYENKIEVVNISTIKDTIEDYYMSVLRREQ